MASYSTAADNTAAVYGTRRSIQSALIRCGYASLTRRRAVTPDNRDTTLRQRAGRGDTTLTPQVTSCVGNYKIATGMIRGCDRRGKTRRDTPLEMTRSHEKHKTIIPTLAGSSWHTEE